ncbi:acireductone synthase [Prosthecomicrobium pneumaticum]|uniref:Enolase-phosphatase E1 n=1 Tax=Prosthecomicrobium pneumaticum TaxID=81895 RepID=A0A7W9L3D2_9HYPH|nr:acireductone synthase [Prosthecomicrobium pneumaticum]MBB5754374.1 enolase-phosphatase E1 [Prosthecomicrobium pneumaticum]
MTEALRFAVDAVLIDIEGTVSPQSYVATVMFPYARDRLADYVARHGDTPEVRAILEETAALAGPGADPVGALLGWIAEDRKAPPLKKIQGLIWDRGFAEGALEGPIYDDAVAALRRWREAGLPLYVYSSGSVKAQHLFFGHSSAGDLRPLFSGHFDTETGAKTDAASYLTIARAIGRAPERVLFLSDNPRELEAAAAAGMPVGHALREATPADPRFPSVRDFGALDLRPGAA